ncbi:cell wall hydrolase [uncultured Sphingomonas sp.]|uniref:cell wall hydrolase n=1 Tax=uncultured Sphingomonas sp. TaxID=158754 RepID=UPI0035CB9472
MRNERFPRRRRRWAVPASVAAFGASGLTWWAVEAQHAPVVAFSPPLTYQVTTDDAVGEQAAPAAGVTGTTALPAVPQLTSESVQVAIAGARPFSMAQGSPVDRARALECLTAAIYYEAASEPDVGQRAVAQVVLNRARHPAFPATVCGVVYQGSERRGCQFSFACDGAMTRAPSRAGWARAAGTAWGALAGDVYTPVGLATHYHTFAVRPVWNRGLVMTEVVGAHFFHRWKGWWGTGAAFRQEYQGGEPMPGPHGPAMVRTPVAVAAVASPPVRTSLARSNVPPVIASSSSALTPAPTPDRLPPASEVLDRWKESGTALK